MLFEFRAGPMPRSNSVLTGHREVPPIGRQGSPTTYSTTSQSSATIHPSWCSCWCRPTSLRLLMAPLLHRWSTVWLRAGSTTLPADTTSVSRCPRESALGCTTSGCFSISLRTPLPAAITSRSMTMPSMMPGYRLNSSWKPRLTPSLS